MTHDEIDASTSGVGGELFYSPGKWRQRCDALQGKASN
jgi:hypothetical protein